MKKQEMKKKSMKCIFIFFFSLVCLLLSACSNTPPVWEGLISVTIVDSPYISVINTDNMIYFERNSDVTFTIKLRDNYYITSISYQNYKLTDNGDNYLLTFYEIKYTTRIIIECVAGDTTITYHANGGNVSGIDSATYSEMYNLTYRSRPNTSIGSNNIERDGYTLFGWNSHSGGKGNHVGLGSRITVERGSNTNLYAEWSKWTSYEEFEYQTSDEASGVKLTGYHGTEQTITIPEYIHGEAVTHIEENTFIKCGAKTVILPKSIISIAKNAFVNCSFTDLYFYDNLINVSDDSFNNCIDFMTVHINAIESPRYVASDKNTVYADKIDLLIKAADTDKKKLILWGGSGTYYSVDACTAEDMMPEYQVINLGVNAWFNSQTQLEIMLPYLNEGDIFLHSPEMASDYQFLKYNDMGFREGKIMQDDKFFCCIEQNFDLIAHLNIRHVSAFFDTFAFFNSTRLKKPELSYTEYENFMDDHGDYKSDRWIAVESIGPITNEGGIFPELLLGDGMKELNGYYDTYTAKGIIVFRAFAAVNYFSLSETDINFITEFEELFIENSTYPVLNRLDDMLYHTTHFSDSDWHLTHNYSIENTRSLVNSLMSYLEGI